MQIYFASLVSIESDFCNQDGNHSDKLEPFDESLFVPADDDRKVKDYTAGASAV